MDPRKRYAELRQLRPKWFENTTRGFEILISEAEMDSAEEAAWSRLERKSSENSHLRYASKEWVMVGVIVETEYLLLIRDAVRFPDGNLGTYERVMPRPEHGTGASILARDSNGNILLLERHRHALRKVMLEAPRGFSRAEESAETTTLRQLREEMQASVEQVRYLGRVAPDGGLLGEMVSLMEAAIKSWGDVELHEAIQGVVPITVEGIHQKIANDEIVDGFTLALYAKAVARGVISPPVIHRASS